MKTRKDAKLTATCCFADLKDLYPDHKTASCKLMLYLALHVLIYHIYIHILYLSERIIMTIYCIYIFFQIISHH